MRNKTPIIALLLAAILVLAGCSATNQTQQTNTTNQTETTDNSNLSEVSYISTDLEQCKVIRFMCIQGNEPFTDDKGCGCRPVQQDNQSQVEPEKVFCTDAQKNAQICTMEYNPVCAWYDETVQCIKFPCAIEAASPCTACAMGNVDYYTPGSCPSDITQTMPADSAPKRAVIECDPSYIEMQNNEAAACTREYRPVCGLDAADKMQTFGNKCEACTTKGVFQYTEGACNEEGGAVI